MLRASMTAFSRFRTPRFPARASRRGLRVRGASAEVLESRLMLSGATLWVDHATPSAYQTIQAAVNAARPGSTILVAPGVYPEAVTVSTTNLTILGGQIHARGESGFSIVETTGVAFTLEANNIQLSHFTIEPPANSTGTAGVEITAGSGDLVQNNLIEAETMGIAVNTADMVAIGSVTINGNTVEQSSADGIDVMFTTTVSLSGNTTNNGAGGIVMEGSLHSVTLVSNKANDNSVFGIFVDAPSVTCEKNTTDDDGTGVELVASSVMVSGNVADGDFFGFDIVTGSETITGNTANSSADAGFNLTVGPGTICNNTANDVTSGGFSAGFFIASDSGTKGPTITNNTASGNAGNGFVLLNNHANFFENTANKNGNDGILLDGVNDDTISDNVTRSNLNDGIEVESTSTDNVFSDNTAFNNSLYDLQDESTGTGTDGTANTWFHNAAFKTSPTRI
jgi:parallel beta-helix repeat protein